MRTLATTAAILFVCSPALGCSSADAPPATEAELASHETSGASSTPRTSQIAAPLPEAGERANYPEGFDVGRTRPVETERAGEPFDIGRDPDDPMMEQEAPVAAELDTEPVGRTRDTEPAADGMRPAACLGAMSDLRIDVTDVYDGAAIIVTSRTQPEGEIFERASALAQAHGSTTTTGDQNTATAKPGEQPGTALDMPPAEVRVIELAHGVRIHYLARNTDEDVLDLRNAVRRIASALERGACPGL